MSSEENDETGRTQRGLVRGTWVIAIAGMLTFAFTTYYMRQQVAETKVANELKVRPYGMIDRGLALYPAILYRIGGTSDNDVRLVDSVLFSTDAYKARSKVVLNVIKPVSVRNIGETPMWMTGYITGIALAAEWNKDYTKSVANLVRHLKETQSIGCFETDMVVFADSVFVPRDSNAIPRTMEVEDFESIRDSTHSLILYPYTYIEYEDFRGEKYNAIFVQFVELAVDTAEGACRCRGIKSGVEQYRWDFDL